MKKASHKEKIFITGGNGVLAKQIFKYCQENEIQCFAPNKEECNILDFEKLKNVIDGYNPTIIIHAAGIISVLNCEENKEEAINVNVKGTLNITQYCLNKKIKLIYISSDSVFSGNKGLYSIRDKLDPINVYGKTKAASEYIISVVENHQIIRAPFLRATHKKVFKNQLCSRYLLNQVADKIIKNILFNSEKIVHISTERRQLRDLYKEMGLEVELISIPKKLKKLLPKDASILNTSKF